MAELLPVGAEVHVTENRGPGSRVYRAIVRGYDIFQSKYHLSPLLMGWAEPFYTDEPFRWAFLSEVTEAAEPLISEGEPTP